MSHDRLRRMLGRDPAETHRAATPLELLFDLVFVVAFAVAGEQAAHLVADGHVPAGVIGFAFAVFAIVWAWINFTWFASAFDTDDWYYRVTTMVQMIGVVVLALGLPEMFRSIDGGQQVDNEVMVAGYVVMRLAMLVQWLRVARQSPPYRPVALVYATTLVIAQLGWVLLAVLPVSVGQFFVLGAGMVLVELAGPVIGERRPVADTSGRRGTPWHPHHVAERYGLLIIITLGEGVIGTVASLSAVVEHGGWTVDAVLVCVAGVALTFGLWWTYFLTPAGDLLARHRGRSFGWGYGHLVVFGSLAAVGAGLHVVAYWLEGEAHLSDVGALLAVAVPVLVFLVTDVVLHVYLVGRADPVRLLLLGAAVALLAAAVAVVAAGGTTPVALLLVMLAPAVTVVVHETGGHRRLTAMLDADAEATGERAPAAPNGGDQAGTLDR